MADYIDPDVFTNSETAAIRRLQKVADTWPTSLTLFSWSGSLVVLKTRDFRESDEIDESRTVSIHGIPNDGGDPNSKA